MAETAMIAIGDPQPEEEQGQGRSATGARNTIPGHDLER